VVGNGHDIQGIAHQSCKDWYQIMHFIHPLLMPHLDRRMKATQTKNGPSWNGQFTPCHPMPCHWRCLIWSTYGATLNNHVESLDVKLRHELLLDCISFN
jgi:hypothetical protein